MVHADNDIAGWLVEWPQSKNNHARWWHPEHGWCIDANDAIRFMRKEDAEAYIKSMRFGDGRVATEHVWFNERLWPKPMGHAYRDIDLAAAAKQDRQRDELVAAMSFCVAILAARTSEEARDIWLSNPAERSRAADTLRAWYASRDGGGTPSTGDLSSSPQAK